MYKSIRQSTQHREYPLPNGPWVMTQKWDHLLFIHWPIPQEVMEAQIPAGLELDTFDGEAWLTIIPFKISDMRLRKMPPFPFLRSFLEVNVRTYVRRNGISGIYFFSMDADKLLAILGARVATLPYFHAKMKINKGAKGYYHYSSIRRGSSDAIFKGSYRPISEAYYPEKGSLAYWLLERYYLYSYQGGALFRGGIHHRQWRIHDAEATILKQNMIPFLLENSMNEEPLLHYASSRRVLFWLIKKVE